MVQKFLDHLSLEIQFHLSVSSRKAKNNMIELNYTNSSTRYVRKDKTYSNKLIRCVRNDEIYFRKLLR